MVSTPEAEFLNVIETKVLRGFPLAIHSHLTVITRLYSPPPPSISGLKLVCNLNIVYGNLKSESSQDYAQKPQRNCTFMNSASGLGGKGCMASSHLVNFPVGGMPEKLTLPMCSLGSWRGSSYKDSRRTNLCSQNHSWDESGYHKKNLPRRRLVLMFQDAPTTLQRKSHLCVPFL